MAADDHLQCYRLDEDASRNALVSLFPADDPPFPVAAGCRAKVGAREVCLPADATVTAFDGSLGALEGQALDRAMLCYRVRCARAEVADTTVTDPFGVRPFTKIKKTTRVCVPAVAGVPPTTTTTTTTTLPPRACGDAAAPACDGACGEQFACVEADGGGCECIFVDIFLPCPAIAGPPNCYGSCADQNSCIDDGGACVCARVSEP